MSSQTFDHLLDISLRKVVSEVIKFHKPAKERIQLISKLKKNLFNSVTKGQKYEV